MNNIVLTSCGIRNDDFKNKFYNIVGKQELKNKKVLYITTASDGETGDKSWMDEEYKTILDLGINGDNITEYKIGNSIDIMTYDIIYMMGGNTFYLLDMIRKNNFEKEIKDFIKSGRIYIGSSAGSAIMGKSIEIALPFDKNIVNMTDFTGLNIIDGLIYPHCNQCEEHINKIKKESKEKLYLLYDGDGIII